MTIVTKSPETIPTLQSMTVDAKEFVKAIKECKKALPSKDHRIALMGLNCRLWGDTPIMEATDGKRAVVWPCWSMNLHDQPMWICPKVLSILSKMKGQVVIVKSYGAPYDDKWGNRITPDRYEATDGRLNVSWETEPRKFPQLEQCLAKSWALKIKIDCAKLREMVDACLPLKTKSDAMVFNFEGETKVKVSCVSEAGKFEDTLPIVWMDYKYGYPKEWAFSSVFLKKLLPAKGTAEFEFESAHAPALIRLDSDPPCGSVVRVLMPIRLADLRSISA